MKKRLFAIFLLLCMALALLPVSVLADQECGDGCDHESAEPVVLESGEQTEPSEPNELTEPMDGDEQPASDCTDGHDWKNKDGVCAREGCGATCAHGSDVPTIDLASGDCTQCGMHVHHIWTNGSCPCGVTCDHSANTNIASCTEETVCSVCGAATTGTSHDWDSATGACKRDGCGAVCSHGDVSDDGTPISTWDNGTCVICGLVCAHTTRNDDDTCAVCGISLEPAPAPEPEPEPEPEPDPTPAPTPVPHTHSYTASVTKAATCTAAGVRTYTCSCGASYTETIAATGHSYYLERSAAATCTTDGLREYTCSVCRHSYQEHIAATGHDWQGKFTVIDGNTNAGGNFQGYVYTCLNCGESYRESSSGLDINRSGLLGLKDNSVTLVGANVHTGDIHAQDNLSVEGTVLPSGGTGYLVKETVGGDTKPVSGVAIESDKANIEYLGYVRQDESGKTTEILEINASKGLQSLSIDCQMLTDGQQVYTVMENGELFAAADVTATAIDGAIVTTLTGTSGSQIDYMLPADEETKFTDLPLAKLKDVLFGDGKNGLSLGDLTIQEVELLSAGEKTVEDSGYSAYLVSPTDLCAATAQDIADAWKQTMASLSNATALTIDNSSTLLLNVGSSVSGGDSGGDTTISGGVLEPKEVQSGDLSAGDEDPTPTPTATPEPEEDEEETVSGWVEIVFGTEDLSEPTPEATIAPYVQETPAPTIAPAAEETPRVIQKFVDPTPTPTPAPTPTPTPKVQWSFSEAQQVCPECGKAYYPSQGHQCKSAWKEFGEGMKDQVDDMVDYVEEKGCVPSGTLITLADGTQKPVEELTADDTLLVFDHEAGCFTTAGINFIENLGEAEYRFLNLVFSDGSETRLIAEHGYFDLDAMEYVYLREDNAADYIGHRFYKAEIVDGEYVAAEATLVAAYVTEEVTGCWETVSTYHLNHYVDGFLSMPGFSEGFFNFFDYDDDLAYNAEAMTADIEQYGLYSYENLAEYMSYEEFASYPAQYLAVSIGKGLIDEQRILEMIELYVVPYRK